MFRPRFSYALEVSPNIVEGEGEGDESHNPTRALNHLCARGSRDQSAQSNQGHGTLDLQSGFGEVASAKLCHCTNIQHPNSVGFGLNVSADAGRSIDDNCFSQSDTHLNLTEALVPPNSCLNLGLDGNGQPQDHSGFSIPENAFGLTHLDNITTFGNNFNTLLDVTPSMMLPSENFALDIAQAGSSFTPSPVFPMSQPDGGSQAGTDEHLIRCTETGCGQSFRRSGDYRRHIKKHKTAPFRCIMVDCPKRFYRLDKLRDHVKQGHKKSL